MQTLAAIREFVYTYPKTVAVVTVTGGGGVLEEINFLWTLTGVGLFGVKKWMAGGVCHSKVQLDGKTVLITGGNTGIGKETAVDLARRDFNCLIFILELYKICCCASGARVILACRDMDRANKAAEDVRKESGNDNVIVKKLDLASLQSVRQLAKDVLANEERLDVLINNAGVMSCPKWLTEDGFEMQFGVNHLGHFLLTNCLLDLLKKSSPSRIVNVSSLAHEKGQIYFDDINLEKDYDPWKSYRQSKLANVLFTRELANRLQGTGVTTYSLHPGVIRTELGRHLWPTMPLWKRVVYKPLVFLIKSPTEGAQTTIYCAVEESLQNESGLYYSYPVIPIFIHHCILNLFINQLSRSGSNLVFNTEFFTDYSDCAPKTAAPQGLDDEAAKKLWDLSASMVGLT
ncbi:Retinol dehydrogenase 13 [Collichthys lucidus]|uniref:Retinol dehydrogenase 13 n=1 Tax=Collichthys lucidus TaxID=240159 RepID=A0A4U5UG02_COLLU|nr:Retinol dehydrogenase 13 [Collichthys lucidus]TKS73439.1 Retinol dehydrogenase 13 [Collichthys lucidus]